MVRTTPLLPDQELPLLVEPRVAGLELGRWLDKSRDWVGRELIRHGGLLFRGFSIPSVEHFEHLASILSGELMQYKERSTPRSQVHSRIYTSTEYPADQSIPMHNESSYSNNWPLKIWFHCMIPAAEGGSTPIADSRRVYELIPETIRERWRRSGVLYVRNYSPSLGLSWQDAFQTEDPREAEEYCRRHDITWRWQGEDRLQTRQVRPAMATHPETGETVWFNQAHLFHASSLTPEVRRQLHQILREEELPRHAYYGDGLPLEEETLEIVRRAYESAAVTFPWQRGDVLLLDNMLTAHGRQPFRGERRIVVAMAEPSQSTPLSDGDTT
jgi:alpha-ketoglutarate-dependent taurine dioxygenase